MANRHTDREYEFQLRSLRESLLLMAGHVEEMIANSVKSLLNRDITLAAKTITTDQLVNRAEVEIDELCMIILAKRQPMASDLRFITLSMKMVTDLERIGDLAVNIAERTIDLGRDKLIRPWEDIPLMTELVRKMVRDAIDAFIERDVEKARKVIQCDDEVDKLYTKAFHELLTLMLQDVSTVERGIHIQSVAKWLERMADHATNIAEQVVYMVKGMDIRHQGKLPENLPAYG